MPPPAPRWRFAVDRMRIDERFGMPRESADDARRRFGIAPGMRVLDVGCGSGALVRFLLPSLGGKGEMVGVDLDGDLLAYARQETKADGVTLRFEHGDAMKLPFEDGSFDAVVSQYLLCVMPDPDAALKEMRRVTRPGGVVASLSCFCKSGGLPRLYGVDPWPGKERFEELDTRFRQVWRTKVRNPGLGLPNGRDLEVWAAYLRAGLEEPRIAGYLPVFASGSADWSDDDAEDYVERRERVDLGLLDGIPPPAMATLAANGVPAEEVRELRDLTAAHYARLKEDVAVARRSMEVLADPMVLITARVPSA